MTINFRQAVEAFIFQEPSKEGKLLERKTEIRFDPLTGESARLVFDPGLKLTPPDYADVGEQTKGKKCPFCEENIYKITPKFPHNISPEGRITEGEAVLFPNLFPYSKHNGVAVFSGQHYVRLEEFTEKMLSDTFLAAQTYLQQVAKTDPEVQFASINWNYLPHSGSSIIHPHIHIIASEEGTNYQRRTLEAAQNFHEKHGESYYQALLTEEKKRKERLIAEGEHISWLHAFAPKSHADFIGIYREVSSLEQLTTKHWRDLAQGLLAIFGYFASQGLASFNLVMNIPIRERAEDTIHVRLLPRLTIGALETSDMNFFQILHQEPLSYKVPEEVTKAARGFFAS